MKDPNYRVSSLLKLNDDLISKAMKRMNKSMNCATNFSHCGLRRTIYWLGLLKRKLVRWETLRCIRSRTLLWIQRRIWKKRKSRTKTRLRCSALLNDYRLNVCSPEGHIHTLSSPHYILLRAPSVDLMIESGAWVHYSLCVAPRHWWCRPILSPTRRLLESTNWQTDCVQTVKLYVVFATKSSKTCNKYCQPQNPYNI